MKLCSFVSNVASKWNHLRIPPDWSIFPRTEGDPREVASGHVGSGTSCCLGHLWMGCCKDCEFREETAGGRGPSDPGDGACVSPWPTSKLWGSRRWCFADSGRIKDCPAIIHGRLPRCRLCFGCLEPERGELCDGASAAVLSWLWISQGSGWIKTVEGLGLRDDRTAHLYATPVFWPQVREEA